MVTKMKTVNLKENFRVVSFDTINYILLTLFALVVLCPIIYVFAVSLSDKLSVLKNEVFLIPKGINLAAYERIFNLPLFVRAYLNTIVYVTLSTLVCIVINMMTAYPLSKKKLKGGSFIMKAITFTMLFSGGIIPYYILIRNLGMIDTLWVMIIPGALSPFYIIIMRTFFKGIPQELEESATIDGCNDFQVLAGIVIPLSKPVIATIALFTAVSSWNGYFSALIFLNSQEKFPLQLILRSVTISNEMSQLGRVDVGGETITSTSIKYAAIIVAIVPMLIIYPFTQKFFIKGMLIGSIKG